MTSTEWQTGDPVRHARFGVGSVEIDRGATVLVRFEHGYEECQRDTLRLLLRAETAFSRAVWDVPLEVVQRAQAEAITSVNSAWGVFSRSRVKLLPHQLWVCRQVNAAWPARWLVADDVGLGKTIEAGLILWPLISRGMVRRLLILCPASLADQWQYRMRTMFDIRLTKYTPEQDTPRSDFWNSTPHVVASVQTLRSDHGGRHERLLAASPWDLLIVDEAHHLNADEEQGPTLGYRLVKTLSDHGKFDSMVFFTGTPHRGKNYGFLAILHLLQPDLFTPDRAVAGQLRQLPSVMIRNNKANVTDLAGRPLFQDPLVEAATYAYSPEEAHFYDLLTFFIEAGLAYAGDLARERGEAVKLVLFAMQKLASSSVAAIRRALRGRLDRLRRDERRLDTLNRRLRDWADAATEEQDDQRAIIEEELVELAAALPLMRDEAPHLEELLAAADAVRIETKTETILDQIETRYAGRSVLFFTEYKATQSLLLSGLHRRHGDGCATFINGDERADDVRVADGSVRSMAERRGDAAERFNSGEVRFLVSTEAGGEGIDLQEHCHTLIHVDLPWNPMRLHQRVGRLNRYGQRERVEVLTIRNPDTVESHIWQLLNDKLDQINLALRQVMDTPEDLRQLVLGLATPGFFDGLFGGGAHRAGQSLDQWFDRATGRLGGQDVVELVRQVYGNVARFDYDQMSEQIPRVDTPDLRAFLEAALGLNGRRLREEDGGLAFHTPDAWRGVGVRAEYERMVLDRDAADGTADRLFGVGHKVIDAALAQAIARDVVAATLPSDLLPHPLVVFRLRDRVTEGAGTARAVVVAVELADPPGLLHDWQLLQRLNAIPWRRQLLSQASAPVADSVSAEAELAMAREWLESQLGSIEHGFRVPTIEIVGSLWPHVEPTVV